MSESLSVQTPSIYVGPWVNWSKGRIQGATLTLSSRDGGLLIAFLALFVRLAGNHMWNIICFFLFAHRSSDKAHPALHHQQQALLRSNLNDVSSAWQHFRLAWHWSPAIGSRRAFRQTIWIALLALFHAGLFLAAGVFSARVAGTVSDVLLNDISCGQFPIPNFGTLAESPASILTFAAISARVQRNLAMASDYAASCYASSAVDISWLDCRPLGRNRVEWTRTNTACPFGDNMCTAHAVQLDTGMIDSNLHLGMNAPPEDRVGYRRVTTCAPIATDGYRQDNISLESSGISERFLQGFDANDTLTGFFYGPSRRLGSPATFYTPTRQYPDPIVSNVPSILPYELNVQSVAETEPSYFDAIPALRVANASTTLLFLLNKARFFAPVSDPWFNATTAANPEIMFPDGTTSDKVTVYTNPSVVSVVSCTEQWQWCNVETNQCTSLVHQLGGASVPAVQALGLNAHQLQTVTRIENAAGPSFLVPLITFLGAPSLLASKAAALGSLPVPDDQWVQEVEHWFGTSMATIQLDVLQYVTGDGSPAQQELYQIKPTPEERWMCRNQIVQRADFTSFSALALALILVIGSLIIAISIFLYEILPSLQTFKATKFGPQWVFNGVLQLQSEVFQSKGLGQNWQRHHAAVPTTDTTDPFHMPHSSSWHHSDLDDSNLDTNSFTSESYILQEGKHGPHKAEITTRGLQTNPTPTVPSRLRLFQRRRMFLRLDNSSNTLEEYQTKAESSSDAQQMLIENGYRMG